MIDVQIYRLEPSSWLLSLSEEQWGAFRAAIGEACQEAEGRAFDYEDTKLLPYSTLPLYLPIWLWYATRPIWRSRDTRPIWQIPTAPLPMRGETP